MIHPGYHLLSEQWADMAEEPLRIVQRTAQALGLPLLSLEIELGPSQVEAVFEATDALAAADNMVLFRSAGEAGAAARRLPRDLYVPAALPEHHVQRLASAPVAGGPDKRRQPVQARQPGRPAARRRTRNTRSRKPANITWPGCLRMRAA